MPLQNKAISITVSYGYAAVYASPEISSKIIGRLSNHAVFSARKYNEDWYKIISVTSARTTEYPEALIGGYVNTSLDSRQFDMYNSGDAYTEAVRDAATLLNGSATSSSDNTPSVRTELISSFDNRTLDRNHLDGYTQNTPGTTTITTQTNTTTYNLVTDTIAIDDSYVITYETDSVVNLTGLQMKDIRGILGMPHQYLPNTDPRIIDDENTNPLSLEHIGRAYADRIMTHMPLLFLTPGVPKFMGSYSKQQRTTIAEKLLYGLDNSLDVEKLVNEESGKYYTLEFAYTDYFQYVNAALRSAAYFLGIENREIDGTKLKSFQWLYKSTSFDGIGLDLFTHEGLSKVIGAYAGCITVYADCGNTVDDSFGSTTTKSQLESAINSLPEQARELNFLVGNIGGTLGLSVNQMTELSELTNMAGTLSSDISSRLGSNNIFSNILNKAETFLAGGRMVFPELWDDSSFSSRSYSCKMKLVSPSGDKLSIYLNILVPIYHIMMMALPRQATGQTYFSPFLVRAFYKGLFNVDMGIITDLNITKGSEGDWTIDGLPTVAEVSFTIKDLYDSLFISTGKDINDTNILSNVMELDYIANSCGVNINDHELSRTIRMGAMLGFVDNVTDIIPNIESNIAQFANNAVNKIFEIIN